MSALPLLASERLALSRERLRLALQNPSELDESSGRRHSQSHPDETGVTGLLLTGLKRIPGSSIVIEAVSSWWKQHPLRMADLIAVDTAKVIVQPMAQRHPLGLIIGILVLGGLFAWSRPWRWILKPALFAGLIPQLFTKSLGHVPVKKWMAMLTVLADRQHKPVSSSSFEPKESSQTTGYKPGQPISPL